MTATTHETTMRFAGTETDATSEATRFAQYSMLNEMPGAIFGVLTVAYIVMSLFALAH
jgi:hypothetical protein